MESTREVCNRTRDFASELSLWHPLYLQFYYLVNDIKGYLGKVPPNATLIDVCCGTKPYQRFVDPSVKYVGVDVDSANANVDIVSSAYSINLEPNIADYVVSFQGLEHLEEPYLMIEEAHRLLKPGGEICLTFPMSEHLHEEPYDFFRYTEHGVAYLLRKAGFDEIEIIRQGTNYANIGRRLSQVIAGRTLLRPFVPIINFVFRRMENRKGDDVMNYMVTAKRK
jgi:ubiquinone/menaquinone biosynthesis C-methylase UbiE